MWPGKRAAFSPWRTITLSVLDGRDVVYIACQNGNRPLDVTFRNGMRLPAPYTATGKAMLSTLPDDEVRALLEDSPWPSPLTQHSVASLDALMPELAQCRVSGFSIDDAQVRDGMHCFGAAVFDASNQQRAVAGLAVSFLEVDLVQPGKADKIGRDIRALADRLSARMGGTDARGVASRRLKAIPREPHKAAQTKKPLTIIKGSGRLRGAVKCPCSPVSQGFAWPFPTAARAPCSFL